MASPKSLYTITGGYGTNTSNWKKTRPDAFVPFHNNNTTYETENVYTKNRLGEETTWKTDTDPSDLSSFNPEGMWFNGNYDGSTAYRHRTINNRNRYSVVLCGWPYGESFINIESATSAPVTQFAGIQFKWNTADSHWSDSAIRINGKDSVGLICYDWAAGKTYVQRTDQLFYSGRSPITDGSNSPVSNNGCAFMLNTSDQTWVASNRVYLVGFYIQFFQKNEGGSSRDRYFNMWDLQILYSSQGAGKGQGEYPYKMVMPGKQSNGIGYHGETPGNGVNRAVKLYHS